MTQKATSTKRTTTIANVVGVGDNVYDNVDDDTNDDAARDDVDYDTNDHAANDDDVAVDDDTRPSQKLFLASTAHWQAKLAKSGGLGAGGEGAGGGGG